MNPIARLGTTARSTLASIPMATTFKTRRQVHTSSTLTSIADQIHRIAKDLEQARSQSGSSSTSSTPVLHQFAELEKLSSELLQQVNPAQYIVTLAEKHCQARALHAVNEWGVADILGDGQLEAKEIAEKAGVRQAYFNTVIRTVLQDGFFEEVGEFGSLVLRNNRLSNYLKADDSKTLKTGISFIGDDGLRAATSLLEASRASCTKTAYQLAFSTDLDYFAHVALPENRLREQRMGRAMRELHSAFPDSLATEFDWARLGAGPLVDVGGGQGATPRVVCPRHKDLRFVLFDRPTTVEESRKVLAHEEYADRVEFVGGDFFQRDVDKSRIPTGAPYYMLRNVLHDWDDEQVVEILTNVRTAMLVPNPNPSSASTPTLFIADLVLTPHASAFLQSTSVQVLSLGGGMERTVLEYERLLQRARFDVKEVHHLGSLETVLEVVPRAKE